MMRPYYASARTTPSRLSLLLLSLLITLAGCGGASSGSASISSGDPGTPAAPTVSIMASPASVAAGTSSMLTVAAANATTVTVSGSDGSSYTLAATGGTQAVKPGATATYTATATGAGGKATGTATVTVTAPAAATVTMTASPASITAGSSSTLTVTAMNASAVTVTGTDGSHYTLDATGGTQAVSPSATTSYTATATGAGGNATATADVKVTPAVPATTVAMTASPTSIMVGDSATLKVTAANATAVTVSGSDGSTYKLPASGGNQKVTPNSTTTYTAEATGAGGTASATATVTVSATGGTEAINHVIFMLQENHTFDNYFGMLNPYRRSHNWNVGDDGQVYDVDGIDDKLNISNKNDSGVAIPLFKMKSACIDDASSAWLESYGDVSAYNKLDTRPIRNDGFAHNAAGFARSCAERNACSGDFTDTDGRRAMGYYDQDLLNYYYYMAAQFAVSDRWFSPISSKSTPNRIATYSGGTTQGLAFDPGYDDHVGSLGVPSIFKALDDAGVSWKVYYISTQGECGATDPDCGTGAASYPATTLGYITYAKKYLYPNPKHAACTAPTQPSSVVGDKTNYYCIDTNHVARIDTYYTDLTNGTLPSVAFIEPGYGVSDEHPGSFQPILRGQAQVAQIINAFMASPEWKDSVFFFSYDEGGGPYDHVPPVPHHSNDFTDAGLGAIPDIASISVNPDKYDPCLPPDGTVATGHCDLRPTSPGAHPEDAAAVHGFAAQLGFRLPNIVISPFTRKHYVSHIPMDHTAVIKFVESRFIGPSAHLTARDAAQPNLLDFFDFSNVPWATPPTPPVPASNASLGYNACTPANMGP